MVLQRFEGIYHLSKLLDADKGEIPVPRSDFKIQMQPGKESNQFMFRIKIGNSMGASVTVSDSNDGNTRAVSITALRSTRMMPPKELFRVECALSDILPAANLIHLEDNVLIIEGPKGEMQCTRYA
jgi:META domain